MTRGTTHYCAGPMLHSSELRNRAELWCASHLLEQARWRDALQHGPRVRIPLGRDEELHVRVELERNPNRPHSAPLRAVGPRHHILCNKTEKYLAGWKLTHTIPKISLRQTSTALYHLLRLK